MENWRLRNVLYASSNPLQSTVAFHSMLSSLHKKFASNIEKDKTWISKKKKQNPLEWEPKSKKRQKNRKYLQEIIK